MAVLVVISAFGAINGMIFTTARSTRSSASIIGCFRRSVTGAGGWHAGPAQLIVQGVISLLLIAGVTAYVYSTNVSRRDAFDTFLIFTAAVFWAFFLLTGIAFFVLREMDRDLARPFRVPFYPLVPLAFCGACAPR